MHQKDPPAFPQEYLPTMYDLPSEDPEDPGLPDEFHIFQPQLLRETFIPPHFPKEQVFIATDLNLYYDLDHLLWYKRPDWFAVLGISRLYENQDLRLSYVMWQEGAAPNVVIELLSPGTEKDDLGERLRDVSKPPTKWEVYEQILKVPNYVVFDRYTDQLKAFQLRDSRYIELEINQNRLWMNNIQLGLGLWYGVYEGIERKWLRWFDTSGNWILTQVEQERQRAEQERQRAEQERQRAEQEKQRAEQEKQRAEQEKQRAERLAQQLRALGIQVDSDTGYE